MNRDEARKAEDMLERIMDVALLLEPALGREIRVTETQCRYEIFLETERQYHF